MWASNLISAAPVSATECMFESNRASGPAPFGGAVSLEGCAGTSFFGDSTFRANAVHMLARATIAPAEGASLARSTRPRLFAARM